MDLSRSDTDVTLLYTLLGLEAPHSSDFDVFTVSDLIVCRFVIR